MGVKSVHIRSYSGQHFSRIRTEYSVSLRIQSKCGKMLKNPDQNISEYGYYFHFQRIFCIARQHKMGQLIKNRLISPTLTLSWRRSPLYRNQTNDLQSKSMDRFLYDREPLHERVKHKISRTLLFDLMCLFLFDFDNQNNQ